MNTTLKFLAIYGLFLFCFIGTLNGQIKQVGPKSNSIKEAISKPWGKLFYIERIDGKYKMGDTISQFNNNKEFEHLTFDISNNKVLANVGIQGSLKRMTIYRDSYFSNCSPPSGLTDGSWPGVWAAKDNSSYGPYSFSIELNGKNYDLDKVEWDFRTGLLDNLIPITELKGPNDQFKINLLTFAPISTDGKKRVRGLVYGLFLENNSTELLSGTIHLPKLFTNKRQDVNPILNGPLSWAIFDPYDFEMAIGDTEQQNFNVSFNLKKGEGIWVPVVFNNLGDTALYEINSLGTIEWLNQTEQYFRNIVGQVKTPEDPYLSEFFERQVLAAFGSIAMSESGKIAGSNWGSYPATRQIWMKDFYYSCLPFMRLDKDFAQKLILWFSEFGVRPKGNAMKGGVNHSVGISMASIMLAGQYYENTGDKEFFSGNIQLKKYWNDIITELISSRKDPDIWLFPSKYISDGSIKPDYHTGSNVCAWFALKSYARLLKEVYNEQAAGKEIEAIAGKVQNAIMDKCTINGPFGKQFIEATYRDGSEAPMESDGEESDITLMPYYGFLSWDDPTYLNYMRFSVSEHNTIYRPDLHAISWFGVPSTAPGYLKGLCAGTDHASLFGEHGYLNEIRKITDADGSIWWWNYYSKKNPEYGEVERNSLPGKSGWFSGIYASVFIARHLGLSYDQTTNSLRFSPLMPSSGFTWNNFTLAGKIFSANYHFSNQSVTINLKSGNPDITKTDICLPVQSFRKGFKFYVNGRLSKDFKIIKYLNQDYISSSIDLPGKGEATILVSSK